MARHEKRSLLRIIAFACVWTAILTTGSVEGAARARKQTRRAKLSASQFTAEFDFEGPESKVLNIEKGRRHLDFDTTWTSGLPQSCLTYEERYAPYRTSAINGRTLGMGNQQIMSANYVVVVQMHKGHSELKEDLVLHLRALAREVQSVGFHFYILYQVPTSWNGESIQHAVSHEQVLSLLPDDFRDVIIVHDAKEEYEIYYPKIAQNRKPNIPYDAPGPRAPHAGMSLFMHRYQSYAFAFVLEYDIRLSGHWGHYLASALKIAVEAKGTDREGTEGVDSDHEVITDQLPPGHVLGLPDLIAFESIWESDKWLATQVGFDFSMLEEMKAMIYGGSRKLFDKMHETASEGRDVYIESLLPLLPRLIPGGKRIVLKIPTQGESFHCNSMDGLLLYKEFMNPASGMCTQNYLVHPIKNEESWWPLESSHAPHSHAKSQRHN